MDGGNKKLVQHFGHPTKGQCPQIDLNKAGHKKKML